MFILTSKPKQDTDNDGIPDVCDNCLEISNTDQTDGDHDGPGDVCDPHPEEERQEDTNQMQQELFK